MNPSVQAALIVALVAIAVGAVAVVLGTIAIVRYSRLHRAYGLLAVAEGRETVVDVMGRTMEEFTDLRQDVLQLEKNLAVTRRDLSAALRHVSVVRYDAFGDMGGRMSFSTALLDDNGDGLLITSIHGRSGTRTYMKPVTAGSSEQVSPEEQEAINRATGRTR